MTIVPRNNETQLDWVKRINKIAKEKGYKNYSISMNCYTAIIEEKTT